MGREVVCTVRNGAKSSSGKALLETGEILFRGEPRLKIVLSSLQSVVARDGELHLRWPDGTAVFELGEHADKWAHKILHPKSIAEKLGIKPGLVISVSGVKDEAFCSELRAAAGSFSDAKPLKNADLIFLGAEKAWELGRAGKVTPFLAPAGALWIVYPKGRQEIKERQVMEAGKQAGLVDVKVVSFSATHTALKFVRRKGKIGTLERG